MNQLTVLLAVITLIIAVVVYFKRSFSHWKRKNVPYLKPSIPFGNLNDVLFGRISFAYVFNKVYQQFKIQQNARYAGFYIFTKPVLVIFDPDLIKSILITNFDHFTDRGFFLDKKHDPTSAHLFSLKGNDWKKLREKFTVVFTASKIRTMFEVLEKVADNLSDALREVIKHDEPFEIREMSNMYTSDSIASVFFGLEMNSFKCKNNQFFLTAEEVLGRDSIVKSIHVTLSSLAPSLLSFFRIKFFPRSVREYFTSLIIETIRYREEHNVERKDFLSLMMKLRNRNIKELGDAVQQNGVDDNKLNENGLTLSEIIGQAILFVVAGFDTSSTTIGFALVELAANKTFQNKARQEIYTVLERHDGKLTYESLKEMTYLDYCIQETLRMYPPLPNLFRECTKNYKIPDSDLTIKKGDTVYIPILNVHRDPKLYPNPDQYNPDRFVKQNDENGLRQVSPWLPFGEGPRNCIGLVLGKLQSKIAIAKILKDFEISLDPKIIYPTVISPKGFLLSMKGGAWLQAKTIDPNFKTSTH